MSANTTFRVTWNQRPHGEEQQADFVYKDIANAFATGLRLGGAMNVRVMWDETEDIRSIKAIFTTEELKLILNSPDKLAAAIRAGWRGLC